jgi:uncharacterized protein (TIGR02246 family)
MLEVDERSSKGDKKGAARAYALDADVVDTKANWSQGRDQIEKYLTDSATTRSRQGGTPRKSRKLAFPSPDVAVATTRWRAHKGSENQTLRGMGILILRRGSEQWSIVATQNTIS